MLVLAALPAAAQTFEINPSQPSTPQPAQNQAGKKSGKKAAKSGVVNSNSENSNGGIGWGSSIEVGRMARAAEDALRKHNYALAADYAQRAVKAAPQDSRLWFLLGYTSRLAGKFQASLDAYKRGLQSQPNSAEGLSGEAQTYAKLGNTDEAKRLLMQVIAAHPERVNDILIAGELDIQTGDLQHGLSLLQRAEASQPSSHSELLMALAYMKLKEPAKAKDLLERARRRDPKNVEIFRAVANFQRESKDYAAAIATLKSSPRVTPEVLGDLAYTYELAGQTKESAATYVRAANADPGNIRMQLSAAQSQIALGDLEKGKSFLARAAALDADHYRLHAIRANLAKIEHRDADAIQEYNLALAHLPQGGKVAEGDLFPIDLRLNLSELYKQAGDEANAKQQMALAEQEINRIHVEGPAMAEFLRVRASIKQGFNDPAGAEADLKQAMSIDPANTNIVLQYANLLWKTERKDQARNIYVSVLNKDPKNRYALEAMGYLARDAGDAKTAEQYFNQLAAAYPEDYVAYLALGDMFTASRDFTKANTNYQKAFTRSPKNSTVVANATNAAIEARNFNLARVWVDRATGAMNDDPRVVRERERYLFHTGKYLESARLGYKVLQKLPKDRNASVYLGYDLYNLGRYDDVLALADKYENILPKEPNFPLLAGHVHKQAGLLDEAVDDYSRAQERDPKMVEAYVNRGYVENDLQQADQASQDFHHALQLNPNNGTAHLGLAFADLQLRHGKLSLQEADEAQKLMGESGATHLAKATAYRQLRALTKAEREYRLALKSAPDDEKLHLALADTLYHMRRYTQSLGVLSDTLRLAPEDTAQIYAQMAHAHAQLHHREETLKYVAAAEREDNQSSAILLNTGDALLTLGDKKAAMDRFAHALEAPDADRVEARLAIAKLFVRENKWDDARQQVGLAFAEARVGEASPVTADELIEAANVFLAIQDFKLATRYFAKARDAGAGEDSAVLGIANADVAQGDDVDAAKELATLGDPAGYADNYDYNLTMGNIYRHRRDNFHALGAFARANDLAGESDDVAERELMEVSGEEGMRINNHLGILSDISSAPIFEDPTIYEIDARLFQVTNPKLLPTPRATTETKFTEGFNLYQKGLPPVHGFFQVRDARGQISLPFESLILNRRTRDYNLNSGITPSIRLGHSYITLDAGLQYTIRRDSFNRESALDVNQNLFRQYLYLNTTPFGSWLAVNGSAYHEAGGFTERKLNSRDLGARLEFVLGRPWGKTSVITGYSVRDLLFNPLVREFFTTSTYAGLERRFGTKVKVKALGEYIRSWRVSDLNFATAQAMRPAGEIEFRPNNRWLVDGSLAYGRGEGFHSYDNVQSGFFISYSKPLHTTLQDAGGRVPVEYPLRFSIGLEQQTFSSYAGRGQTFLRPVVRLTLF